MFDRNPEDCAEKPGWGRRVLGWFGNDVGDALGDETGFLIVVGLVAVILVGFLGYKVVMEAKEYFSSNGSPPNILSG